MLLTEGFFKTRLNVHMFNCRHRADRRVEGGVRYGWMGEQREKVRGEYRVCRVFDSIEPEAQFVRE
jgi:hypothetical protein